MKTVSGPLGLIIQDAASADDAVTTALQIEMGELPLQLR